MALVAPNPLLVVVFVVVVLYVRIAWWGTARFGRGFPWIAAIGAAAVVASAAALLRAPASADELLFARPALAWLEAAVLAGVTTLPIFGFAARSVAKRSARNAGGPSVLDWIAGVWAGLIGLFLVASAVIVLGLLVWK